MKIKNDGDRYVMAVQALREIAKPKYDSNHKGRGCPACIARMALLDLDRIPQKDSR